MSCQSYTLVGSALSPTDPMEVHFWLVRTFKSKFVAETWAELCKRHYEQGPGGSDNPWDKNYDWFRHHKPQWCVMQAPVI